MNMNPVITDFCHIKNNQVFHHGNLVFAAESGDNSRDFIKAAFRNTDAKYPKFFKMDDYSKLGLLAVEILMKSKPLTEEQTKTTGIVLSNSQATLVTDQQFQETIQYDNDFFPSPAVFVYTLPNIMAGEIAIRHRLYGENAFFVSSSFDFEWHEFYVNELFNSRKIESCLSGWVDVENNRMEAFVYLVQNTENSIKHGRPHLVAELKKMYNHQ